MLNYLRFGQWKLLQASFHAPLIFLVILWALSSFVLKDILGSSFHFSPQSWNQPFSKKPWFLLVERSVWKARSRHYICSLQLGYHCSQILLIDRTRKHMYIHTHTHPLYSFIYICWKPGVCSDTYNSNLPPQVHFRFSSFHIAATFVRKVIQNHPHLGFLSEFLGVKNPPANAGDMDSILGSGRCPGEGDGNLLQCSGLGNPVHRGAWQATVSGVTKSCTFMSMNPRLHSVHLLICSIFLHVNDFLTLLYASLSCATYNPRLRLPSPLWLTALFGPI